MQMLISAPPPDLSDSLLELWSLRGDPAGFYTGLPKPFVECIISLSGHHAWRENLTSESVSYTDGWLTPVQSGPRFAKTTGGLHLLGARLSLASAHALFGPFADVDRPIPVPLRKVIGDDLDALIHRLAAEDNEEARLTVLADWLRTRPKRPARLRIPTKEGIEEMGWRVDALAEFNQMSTRTLRKHFLADFGISPKLWMQISRFDSVLTTDITGMGKAALAARFGYTDQAHMAREFKRFSGASLGVYLAARETEVAPANVPHFMSGA